MIYEFFHNFWSQLDAGSYFPQGMSIELLERCLVEEEITGKLLIVVIVKFFISFFGIFLILISFYYFRSIKYFDSSIINNNI